MALHYGITDVREIFGMTWRKFTILFFGIFSWRDDPNSVSISAVDTGAEKWSKAVKEADGADARIAHTIDWNAALGKPPADSKTTITTAEFQKGMRDG